MSIALWKELPACLGQQANVLSNAAEVNHVALSVPYLVTRR